MAFDPKTFVKLRPYAYHLTAAGNLDSIRKARGLRPATELLDAGGKREWLDRRRPEKLSLTLNQATVEIR